MKPALPLLLTSSLLLLPAVSARGQTKTPGPSSVLPTPAAPGRMAGPRPAQSFSGDMSLSQVLIEGEDWQPVAEGYQFTDAACADAEGNFYFTDVARGTSIQKVGLDGKVTAFIEDTPKISGLKFGPDGRLFACTQGPKRQIVAFEIPSGKMTVIAEDVQPNDLAVTRQGFIYFTETGKKQVTVIDPQGRLRPADVGIGKPNGITLSPDQGTLAVSDYGGSNAWVFRIEPDGRLTAKERYMELRTPPGKTDSLGDGMTVDAVGRYYVTSAVGIQMFDPTGRLGGVIAKPQNKGLVSVAFAGPNLQYLYAACTDRIYRRKTQTTGVTK